MSFGSSRFMDVDSETAVVTAGEGDISEYEFNDLDMTDPLLDFGTGSSLDYWVNLYDQDVIDTLGPNHPGQGVFYTGWTGGYGMDGTAPDTVPPEVVDDLSNPGRLVGRFKGQTGVGDNTPRQTDNDGWVPFYPIDPDYPDYVRHTWKSTQEELIYKMIRRKYEPYITRYDHQVTGVDVRDASIYAERHRIQAIAADWGSSRDWVNDIVYNAALIGCNIDKSLIGSTNERSITTLGEGVGIGGNGYKNMLFSSVSGPDDANTAYTTLQYSGAAGGGDTSSAKDLLEKSYLLAFGDTDALAQSGMDVMSGSVVSPTKKKDKEKEILSDYVGPLVCHRLFGLTVDNHTALKTWIPSPDGYIVRQGLDEGDQPDLGPGYDKSEWGTSVEGQNDNIWPYWPEGNHENTGEWKRQNLNISKPMDWRGLYERYLRTCSNEEVCYANWNADSSTSLIKLGVTGVLMGPLAAYYAKKYKTERARRKVNEAQHATSNATSNARNEGDAAVVRYTEWAVDRLEVTGDMQVAAAAADEVITCLEGPCPEEEVQPEETAEDALEDIGEDLGELAGEEEEVGDDIALASVICGPECGAAVGAIGTVAVLGVGLGSAAKDAWDYFKH